MTEPFREIVFDTETDGLDPNTIHVAVAYDINTKETFTFVQDECFSKLPDFLKQVKKYICHNFIEYDSPKVLKKLLNIEVDVSNVEDTYVMSRLAYSDRFVKDVKEYGCESNIPQKYKMILRDKSHSLEAWGIRVGRYKPEIKQWSVFDPAMVTRCQEDVLINYEVYKILKKELQTFSDFSIRLEHKVAEIIAQQCARGFTLDVKFAQEFNMECTIKAQELKKEIVSEIPPHVVKLGDKDKDYFVTPRIKEVKVATGRKVPSEKTGKLVNEYEVYKVVSESTAKYDYVTYGGMVQIRGPFSPISFEPFNPDSPKQRLEVLNKSGWEPVNFNEPTESMLKKGIEVGNPKTTDEENLDTIPDDAPQGIKKLGMYLTLQSKTTLTKTWLEDAQKSSESRIHGYVNSCGTPTGRMRHACVPMNSKILTRDGWKTYDEVLVGEDVLAYDMQTKTKKWTPLINKVKYKNAEVGSIGQKHERKRLYCTSNHKWVVRKAHAKTTNTEHLVEASELRKGHSILINAPFENDVSVRDFKIIHKKYDFDWVKEICKMSNIELNSIMQGFLLADGYMSPLKTWSFAQAEGNLMDAFMTCFYLITDKRVSAVLKTRLKGPKQRWGYNVQLTKNQYMRTKDMSWRFEKIEDVWCPETKYGTWVMKQGDFITITGNSPNMANIPAVGVVDKFDDPDKEHLVSLNLKYFEKIPSGNFKGHIWAGTKDKPKVLLTGIEGKYGYECRRCWIPAQDLIMVGADASSLELRMLAHYMNDTDYTHEVLNGDIHAKNQKLANLPTRSNAKTFIFGFIYGAGDAKVGKIVGGTKERGARLKKEFLQNLPSLKKVMDDTKKQAKRGWLRGLDGRVLWVRHEHAALNLLLQSAGAIVMKVALCFAYKEFQKNNIPVWFLANVHDEWQTETLPEYAEQVGKILVESIRKAGKTLKMNIPLDGEYKVGYSWAQTH